MNRFSDEIRIISPIAWIIAGLVAVCMFVLLFIVILPHDPKLGQWPEAGQIAFATGPALLLFVFVLLVGYINADARRRGMRYVMWTLLAIFVPNSIGIILYFIFRDPLLATCAKCGAQARVNFAFCPQCGTQLNRACPACKRPAEASWSRCAYCGSALGAGSSPGPGGRSPAV